MLLVFFFFQAEDGIRDLVRSRWLGDVYKRQLIGYVFQNPDNQIFASTVKEEVGFGLKVLGENAKVIEKNVAEALAVTGLEGYENMSPFVLSKGVRQRVAVASVLSVKPEAIILDEPTTGLDYQHQRGSLDMLKRLNKKGHTVVIITHSMWIAEEYADRCIVMKDGEIISDGKTRAVFADEDRLVPVSYTHLRAHETVLDLVCRLLLEKKKKINKKNEQKFMIKNKTKQ